MTAAPTDLERILALPRRSTPPADLAQTLTDHLSVRPPPWSLYPEQAQALLEAADESGLIMSAAVGSGKSIVMYLIATVRNARRPMVLIPAHLREKTERELVEYSEFWNIVPPVVKSYTEISRDKDRAGVSRLLQNAAPDVIVCDEAHHLARTTAGCTKKVLRYLEANEHCAFFALTGTMFSRGLMDGWHIAAAALRGGSPLPLRRSTCEAWARACDPGKPQDYRDAQASAVGLSKPAAFGLEYRQNIRAHINATPGFVSSGTKYDGPLEFSRTRCAVPEACVDLIAAAADGRRPDGEWIDPFKRLGVESDYPGGADESTRTILSRWRLAQTLFLGYWDRPDPEPPAEWVLARACWGLFVRRVLEQRPELDTPEAVQYAVEARQLDAADNREGARLFRAWSAARENYKYSTVAEWVDRDAPALVYAAEWLNQHPAGLVWVPSESAGHRVCELAGFPLEANFYGAGQGKLGRPVIEQHRGPAVLSIDANKSGRNLQGHLNNYAWRDNLLLATPSLSGEHEQVIGRTHRPGQKDVVTVEYICGLDAHDRAWQAALDNAAFVADITGDPPKILRAAE